MFRHVNGQPNSRDYSTSPLISAYNLVLQRQASKTGVRVGENRYFFPSSSENFSLGPGLEAFRGYYASVRPTYKSLMVNVNVCMAPFYVPGNLADILKTFQRLSHGAMPQRFLSKIKVTTSHLGYKRKRPIFAIETRTAAQISFDCPELGGNVSVQKYFERSNLFLLMILERLLIHHM